MKKYKTILLLVATIPANYYFIYRQLNKPFLAGLLIGVAVTFLIMMLAGIYVNKKIKKHIEKRLRDSIV